MFTKIIAWIKEAFSKMIGRNDVSRALSVETAISSEMATAIQMWAQIYNNKSPWLSSQVKSLNLGALISSEMARTATIEMKSAVTGSARADYINAVYQKMIADLRKQLEYGLAKGGLVIKPYVSSKGLAIDYVQADCFYPSKFDDDGNVTAAVFVEQLTKSDKTYTRLEYHDFDGSSELITNSAFVANNPYTLGRSISLESVPEWAGIVPEIVINDLKRPMFAYLKCPMANQVDTRSPLGVSIYSRAVELIEQADRQYSRLLWEFESGERALYADVTAFKRNPDGTSDLPNKKLYKTLDVGMRGEGFFHDWTPTLREENILRGLDDMLMKIEDLTGLSRGTLSNPQTEARTATELKILKQRSYATICDIQKATGNALEHAVYIMDALCTLYKLAPAGAYEVSFDWDDSIVSDRDKQFAEYQLLQTMGIISKEKLYAWYFGTTEEEAAANIPAQPALSFGTV